MGSATLTSLLDTHVGQDQPTTNYNLGASMYIRQWSGSIRVGYIYFGRPFPIGATITSAKLHLYGYAKPVTGTIQMYLRRLNQTINYSKVTWNTRATEFAYPEVYSSKSGTYPDRTEYVFDIAGPMQAVADGAKWYGFQLGSDWTATTWSPRFMSSQFGIPEARPWVEITWSDAPDTPAKLSPAAGRVVSVNQPTLRCDYVDVSGDTEISGIQVQVHTSNTWTSPAYDSGVQDVSVPQWPLAGSAFTATAGTTYYWRVRVRDGAGLWSGWSLAATFSYRPLPALTIQNPPASPNNFVEEPTPPITWNTTGQVAYQLGLYRVDNGRDVLIWSRPRTTSSTTDGFTVPAGVITVKDATYRIDVRVYDTYDREATPGAPAYQQVTRYFTYEFSALTSPVTNLTGVAADPRPGVTIEWDRSTAPDSYSVIRDGKVIAAGLDPDNDTFVSGIHNRWVDRFPVKGKAHVYSVQAVVNGKASASNPTVPVTNRFVNTWLVDANSTKAVCIVNDQQRTMVLGEQSATYEPLGATAVVVVTQGMRGYEGTITGEIWGGLQRLSETITTWRENFLYLKSVPSQKLYLLTDDYTFPIVMQNGTVAHLPGNEGTGYAVSFDFFQTGDLTYAPKV